MKKFENLIFKLSKYSNIIAAGAIVITMLLIVANIILRRVFKLPIEGTYDYVGYLTAIAIALSLAYCGVVKGHIAIGFFTEKISEKKQKILGIIVKSISMLFLLFSSWHVIQYGNRTMASGQVSTTTQMPVYPFIYIIAIGLVLLSLVIFVHLINLIKKKVSK